MKLSIVVPVYCVEATLERCLKSIVGQTFQDFEVILVDDGSPDRCPQLCDQWAENDKRIRVIHQQNGGLSEARNTGIDHATGEYITFVDSDDYLDTNTYAQVMPLTAQADIVEFPLYRHYGSDEQEVIRFEQRTYNDMKAYWLEGKAYEHSYAWNKIYRRELFSSVRFPKGKVFEDVATLPLLLDKAQSVMTTDKGLYYYCVNKAGITQQAKGEELNTLLKAHLEILKRGWCDDEYYMHVLNIQIDVYCMTKQPLLLHKRSNISLRKCHSRQLKAKALLLNTIGMKGLCQVKRITAKKS